MSEAYVLVSDIQIREDISYNMIGVCFTGITETIVQTTEYYSSESIYVKDDTNTFTPVFSIPWVTAWKEKLFDRVLHDFKQRYGYMLLGLVFGIDALDEDIRFDARKSGLSHIFVVSGSNITMLYVFLVFLFSRFSKGSVLVIAGMMLYILFLPKTLVMIRAIISACCLSWIVLSGKRSEVLLGIWSVAAVMAVILPGVLQESLSLQLSFSALLGLSAVSYFPIQKLPPILQIAVVTSVVQVYIFPISVGVFGGLSLSAVWTNMLVLPALAFLPVLVFFYGVFDMFQPVILSLLQWIEAVNQAGALWPYITYTVSSQSAVLIFGVLVVLLIVLEYYRRCEHLASRIY